ncbi:MAG TPA: hypothetical protein VN516_00135, partial [Candidatus Baltobacteraceae bacterium]|nr:hypothetical protein [Candidatus Baltobacteraceae bacterium]
MALHYAEAARFFAAEIYNDSQTFPWHCRCFCCDMRTHWKKQIGTLLLTAVVTTLMAQTTGGGTAGSTSSSATGGGTTGGRTTTSPRPGTPIQTLPPP